MAAALDRDARLDGGPHGAAEIDAGDGAARADGGPVRVERDGERRTAEALLQARRDQARRRPDASRRRP